MWNRAVSSHSVNKCHPKIVSVCLALKELHTFSISITRRSGTPSVQNIKNSLKIHLR